MQNLQQLLLKIQQNKTVNFDQLVKLLPASFSWQAVFSIEQVGKNKHIVTIKDSAAFNALLLQSKPANTRNQAARHAFVSSHNVKCDSAYMLCFPSDAKEQRVLNAAAITQGKPLPLAYTPSKHAILIENQDCFFQWQRLEKHFSDSISWSNSDIYFSAGKRILNPLFAALLPQYQTLTCLFDYDLAGLQIANQLRALHYAETLFAVPNKLATYADLFTFAPKTTKQFADMVSLCNQQNLHELATIISQTRCFMEQEALLTLAPP